MTSRSFLALAVWLAAALVPVLAAAQPGATPPAATPPATAPPATARPIDAFLEQRVVEELVAEGIVLSRLGVSLDIEVIGDKLLVTLIDLKTGRAGASTKIDAVPPDREAAVALTTQVVADLAVQLGAVRTPPPPSSVGAQPPPPGPAGPPEPDARARELAELRYARESIGFTTGLVVHASGSSVSASKVWYPVQGELQAPLTPAQFYNLVERPDLYKRYRRNTKIAIGSWIAGGTLTVLSITTSIAGAFAATRDFDLQTGEFDDDSPYATPLFITAGVSGAGAIAFYFAALYYTAHQHPINEVEAKSLADQHNQKLRGKLGLPTASRERLRLRDLARDRDRVLPRVRDVVWTPALVGEGGGGLAVLGRF